MTPKEIQIVKKTWSIVAKLDPTITATLFYSRLSANMPEIKNSFKNSIDQQGARLVSIISFAINKLDKRICVVDKLSAFAKRHVVYGIKPGHYLAVGNALIWTLAQALDENWNEEIRAAWVSCYTRLSNTMIEAAYSVDIAA